jgi:hypothetical protein
MSAIGSRVGRLVVAAVGCGIGPAAAAVQVKTEVSRDGGDGVSFREVPVAATDDAAAGAEFVLVDGERDRNGAGLEALNDGRLPGGDDDPGRNFFFEAGTDGGRLKIDLGRAVRVKRVSTFSWHPGSRGPQVYTLYGAEGAEAALDLAPKRDIDPAKAGWTEVASVDTRPGDADGEGDDGGGRHGVAVAGDGGDLGEFRYLLIDIRRTEDADGFGNTFFSEIDVVDASAPEPQAVKPPESVVETFATEDGKYRFTLEATDAPDLMEWALGELKPVVLEWYPKIVAMLPSDGFEAREDVRLRFRNDMGGTPASAGGGNVNMNAQWFRRELQREARGAVVHELVHVVQSYGRGLRARGSGRVPGWITEGIPDYIRWFLYEPESRGAAIAPQNAATARHDASYRVTGNFLDWATRTHDPDLVRKLNTAAREGRYEPALWATLTGKPVEELADEWRKALAEATGAEPER